MNDLYPSPETRPAPQPGSGPSRRTLRRLLRNLRSPAVPRLLDREDLWIPEFASLYQAYCDEVIFGDPIEGLRLAHLGLMLADRVGDPDILSRAYAILGSGLRARDQRLRAEWAYRRALRLARCELVRADGLQRFARLLAETGRGRQGLEAADEAVFLFRQNPEKGVPDAQSEATALVIRGWIYQELSSDIEALGDFSAALELADPVREPRTHDSALHNTACLILAVGSVDQLALVLDAVRALRRRYSRSRHRVVPKYMLLWLEGLIHRRLGLERRAETLLSRAREGLAGRAPISSVLQVSLDLLRLYMDTDETQQIDDLCHEIATLASLTESSAEPMAMLVLLDSEKKTRRRLRAHLERIPRFL